MAVDIHPTVQPGRTDVPAGRRTPVARVIAGSLVAGATAALVLTLVVVAGASEYVITGAALVAFGAGWGMLAALTTRFTSQPQRWARVPAVLMVASGLALWVSSPGDTGLTVLGWVWPPVALGLAVWMLGQVRRALSGRSRWLLYPVVVAIGVAAVGAGVEDVAQVRDQHRWAAPGKTYDIGGHRLHLDCRGTGGPTVVLENGLSELSASWARVAPAVSRTTRVCTHDRAGQGWSGEAAHPLDGVESARDLHRLLAVAAETGPFVLVGHSTGGTYALSYAHRYPHQVAGMVLLDSSSPYQLTAIPSFAGQYAVTRRALALLPSLSRLGLGRLAPGNAALPRPAADQVAMFSASTRGLRDEQSVLLDMFAQARALTTLDGKPLVVLTASENLDKMPGWDAAQDRLAGLSTNTSHRYATATHVGLLEDPHDAATTAGAVSDVVDAVRTGSPVATR
jgi:pimeloyl-ACP methyl ester carboxylesterase